MLALLLAIPPLLILSALCSAAETAVFSLRLRDRQRLAAHAPASGKAVDTLLADPRAALLAILTANNIVNALIFVIASVTAATNSSPLVGVLLGIALVLGVVLVGEVLPKVFAETFRVEYCRVFAPLWVAVMVALAPVRAVLHAVVSPLVRLFVVGPTAPPQLDPRDVAGLIRLGISEGSIDAGEQGLVQAVISMGTARVAQIMIPRVDVRWVELDATPQDVAHEVAGTIIEHLPVGQGSIDARVEGMLRVRAFLAHAAMGSKPRVQDFLDRPLYIPESARLEHALELLEANHEDAAIVVDELGAVAGLVRVDDIVGLLLPHANPQRMQAQPIQRLDPSTWIVPGAMSVRSWAGMVDLSPDVVPSGSRIATVAGLILHELGRVPAVGDEVTIADVRFRVDAMDGRSITAVRIAIPNPDHATNPATPARSQP